MMETNQRPLSSLLLPYQSFINEKLHEATLRLGSPSSLRDACAYAISVGGKRFRPALVLLVAEALGKGLDVTEVALAVEYFHNASLLADDLPCMDDDTERRGKPATHVVYGEATALLASYALIAAGYEAIAKNASLFPEEQRGFLLQTALEKTTKNTGIRGATGGQFADLFPSEVTVEKAREAIEQKTASLFAISFVFGWLFGGGEGEKVEQVEKAAYHFGMAFQIADDFVDEEEDRRNGRAMNMVQIAGSVGAQAMLDRETGEFYRCIDRLGLADSLISQLGNSLSFYRCS